MGAVRQEVWIPKVPGLQPAVPTLSIPFLQGVRWASLTAPQSDWWLEGGEVGAVLFG